MMQERGVSIDVRNLGTTPFSQVLDTFEGYLPPDEGGRGGHRRSELRPFQEPGQVIGTGSKKAVYHSDYHVESSFNNEQYDLVTTTVVYLAHLANGKTFLPSAEPVKDFATRIQENFLSQDSKPSFKQALTSSAEQLLTNFGELYPNLLPALWGTYVSGGGRGTQVALNTSRLFLQEAIKGGVERDNADLFFRVPRLSFVMEHPLDFWTRTQGKNRDYEVWCAAQSFAHVLMTQARSAALWLSQISNVQNTYAVSVDKDELEGFKDSITEHVSKLTGARMPEQESKAIKPERAKEGLIVTDQLLASWVAECIEDVRRKGQVRLYWGLAEPSIFGQEFIDAARKIHRQRQAAIRVITGPIVIVDEHEQNSLLTLKEEGVITQLLHQTTIGDHDDFLVVELPKKKGQDRYHYINRPRPQPSLLPRHHFIFIS